MMDERVRDVFLKIRSELLAIVMGICGVSLVVKLVLLKGSLGACSFPISLLFAFSTYLSFP